MQRSAQPEQTPADYVDTWIGTAHSRWMIAPDVVREPTAICVVARLKPGQTAELPYVHDDSKWDYTYSVLDLSYRELRKWDNKLYFAPITREEMNRNTAMVQNPGY